MSKQTIITGSGELAGDGESIRSAFTKVNDNFDELYSALGLDTPPLNLGAFEFSGSTISTTDSSLITIDQATTISSDLSVGGDVLPNRDLGGNLGSPSQQWNSLYVSNNTIFINNVPLGITDTNVLTIDGKEIVVSGTDVPFYNLNGTEMSNADQAHGFTARMSLPANGDSEIPVIVQNNYGDVIISAGTDPGNTHIWTFSRNGNIVLPPDGDIKDSDGNSLLGSYEIDGGNAFTNYTAEITVDGGGA